MADMETKATSETKFRQGGEPSKIKKFIKIFAPILGVLLLILVFATDFFEKTFSSQEYEVYEYAIECVKEELKFPDTADFPSFDDCSINKSAYSQQIITDIYSTTNTGIGNKSMEYAWDVSGFFTVENALGMTLNRYFNVTVVLSDSGKFWCYKCDIN